MAGTIPMFETRTMLAALEQMFPARTFLKETFFKNARLFETQNVDLDFYKGKRRTAAYVRPTQEGETVSRIGYEALSYKPPYIKQKMATTAGDILFRRYGETVYSAETPLQRAQRQMALDLRELDNIITRAEELQCSQALTTGSITLLDGNTLEIPMLDTHKITNLTYLWTDTTHSKPIDDLRSWRQILVKDSGLNPNIVIMGSDVMSAFVNHPQISNNTGALSMVKIDRGQIKPEILANGIIYWGYINEIGCDIYTYDEWYSPAEGDQTPVPMFPANKIVLGSTNARMDALYGPIQDMEALYSVPRFPKSWLVEDPSVRWLMLQASPLMIPWEVDSYLFAQTV